VIADAARVSGRVFTPVADKDATQVRITLKYSSPRVHAWPRSSGGGKGQVRPQASVQRSASGRSNSAYRLTNLTRS
jgi:hypothetical protein